MASGLFKTIKEKIKQAKKTGITEGAVTKPGRRRGGTGGKKTLPGTQGTKGPKEENPGRRKRGLKMLKSRFGHNDSGGY